MKARISTIFKTGEDSLWEERQKTSSLMHVASPILKFSPQGNQPIPDKWTLGRVYKLRLSLFGIFPLGKHSITIEKIRRMP